MLLQQPISNDFGQAQQQQQQQQQQGPGRPAQQSPSGVIRQHPKPTSCGTHSSSPHSLLKENSFTSTQVQHRVVRSGQVQSVSLPVQTNTSLTMPFYSNPMMFSQTNTRPLQDANQRHTDNEFSQDGQLRMLLNQPVQTLVPTSSVTSQPSQCNMGISQTIYTLEQQIMAPSFSMQQVNCNAVLVPSPVFTSPIMIPHNNFISPQSQSAYHAQPQASQHSLQIQQPQQFFQMTQGLVHSGSAQAFLHATNVPQQSTVGYIQQQQQIQQLPQAQQQQAQQQQQQRQYQHSQNQTGDFRNMLTR